MALLRYHDVVLEGQISLGGHIRLRSMTEGDWDLLLKWNNDPDVLYWAEGGDVTSRTLQEVQDLYRTVSRTAFCFVIEAVGVPVGECWLQEMNVARILEQHHSLDCRRIDLMIGEKQLWGQGIGTETIRLLTDFGFRQQSADALFGCFVNDNNPRSYRAFQRVGYHIIETLVCDPGRKSRFEYTLRLTRRAYFGLGTKTE
jgi:RimJ/RimL family protein N-acetyltransferase